MKRLLIALGFLFSIAAGTASAQSGYIVDAEGAEIAIGAPVAGDTAIVIADGGHVVVLSDYGEMIRQEGPFEGTGADIITRKDDAVPETDALASDLLDSLVDLAKGQGRSANAVFGVRGTAAAGGDITSDDIALLWPDTRRFCLIDNVRPQFAVPQAADAARTLVVRRTSRPKQVFQALWPPGETILAWPGDWSPPQPGPYLWSVGAAITATVRFVALAGIEAASSPVRQAALFAQAECLTQADAAFRSALARSKSVQ